jgi:hypothetical protein
LVQNNGGPVEIEAPADGDYGGRCQEWLMLHFHLREAGALIEPGSWLMPLFGSYRIAFLVQNIR